MRECTDEARRRANPPVDDLGADAVTRPVQRRQRALGKTGRFLDDGRDGGVIAIRAEILDAPPVRRHCEEGEGARCLRLESGHDCFPISAACEPRRRGG
ncbi:hypothetical protein D3C87_1861980 [compost metagenome]